MGLQQSQNAYGDGKYILMSTNCSGIVALSLKSCQPLFFCGLLVVAVCTVGVTPAAAVTSDGMSDIQRTTSVQNAAVAPQTDPGTETDSAANNSTETVRSVNPENISTTPRRATSLERAGLKIAESLGVRLEVSANELVEQDYTTAESQLGEAYQNDVIRLTQIAEATENASDDQLAQALKTAGENQRGAINNAEEFQTLYTEYQQARASQNETRAREIAQELAATTAELNQTSTNLTAAYAELSDLNETQAERAQQQIQQALTQAEQISENAQRSTYIETEITVESVSREASPEQPLTISGTLHDTNRTALENRTVELVTPQKNVQTQTNATGGFRLTHTPIQVPAGTSSLTVRYLPSETAGYLGSETAISSRILSRQSTLLVTSTPSTLSNGSIANITGEALVAGQAVEGVPIRVRLDETVLGQTETNQTGAFQVPVSTPITAAAGDKTLTIEAGATGQAVELTTEQRPVTVAPVDTDLEMSATRTNNTTVAVSGQLTRTDGQPLAPQLLTVTIGTQTVGYLQTDTTGQFASEFTLTENHPAIDGTEQTTTVTAEFTNGTTHLAPAQASTTVTFFQQQGMSESTIPALAWALGAVVGLFVCGGVIVFWRSRTEETDESPQTDPSVVPDAAVPTAAGDDTVRESPASLFEQAETVIDSAPEQALQLGYQAARRALADELGTDTALSKPSATHWEFYRTVETADGIDKELTTAFESLTKAYERSTYASEATTSVDVRDLLTPVRAQLVDTN